MSHSTADSAAPPAGNTFRQAKSTVPPAASSRTRSAWIVSPAWDLAFLVATPLAIVPAVAWAARGYFTPEQISLVVVSFASLGHHLPGFMRAYGDSELFRRFRWRFLLAPPIVFVTALLFAWQDLHGLSLVLLFWSTWHGLMQTYGFMRIYDMKRGVADSWSAGLDFALCLVLFVAGLVFSDARVYGISEALLQCGLPPLDVIWLQAARWVVGAASVIILSLYAADLIRRGRRGAGITWNKVVLAGTTGWLYWVSGTISTNLLVGVAMFEIFHAVQYYAIVWVYNRKLADRVGGQFGPLGFLFRHRWTFVALYLAAIAAFGSIRFFGSDVANPTLQGLLIAVLTTSTLLHFYYDGFIWKVREKETSANLDIDTRLSPWQRMQVPAVRHVAKWAFLYVTLAVLVALEWRAPNTAVAERANLAMLSAWTPHLPELKLRLAVAALDENQGERAAALAEEAVALRSRSYRAYAVLGKAKLVDGRYAEAVDALTEAIRLAPDRWDIRRDLAVCFRHLERWEESERQLRLAMQLQPESLELKLDLGLLQLNRGDPAGAVQTLQEALRQNPRSLATRAAFVDAKIVVGEVEQAVGIAREGVKQRPQSIEANRILGVALVRNRQFAEAETVLASVAKRMEDDVELRYEWGVALMHMGRLDEARDAFDRVRQLDPQHALARFQMGNCLFYAERYRAAEAEYRACLELDEELTDAWNNLGGALYYQGRVAEALKAYREALRKRPDQAQWHQNLGQLLDELGDRRGAHEHLQRARQLMDAE